MMVPLLAIKVKPWSLEWLIAAGAYPGFCSMKRLGVFLFPLEGKGLGTFIPGGLGTSLEVCRDKIFAGKIVNMAVLREAS